MSPVSCQHGIARARPPPRIQGPRLGTSRVRRAQPASSLQPLSSSDLVREARLRKTGASKMTCITPKRL
eukprot:11804047-Alexandrium_andersonii.AAC.1